MKERWFLEQYKYRFHIPVAETYIENQSVQHGNETKNKPTTWLCMCALKCTDSMLLQRLTITTEVTQIFWKTSTNQIIP